MSDSLTTVRDKTPTLQRLMVDKKMVASGFMPMAVLFSEMSSMMEFFGREKLLMSL